VRPVVANTVSESAYPRPSRSSRAEAVPPPRRARDSVRRYRSTSPVTSSTKAPAFSSARRSGRCKTAECVSASSFTSSCPIARATILWGSESGDLCGSHPQGRETERASRPGPSQVRAGDQPQDRPGARSRCASAAPAARRRGHRMSCRCRFPRSDALSASRSSPVSGRHPLAAAPGRPNLWRSPVIAGPQRLTNFGAEPGLLTVVE
jgi:hypothetical protein